MLRLQTERQLDDLKEVNVEEVIILLCLLFIMFFYLFFIFQIPEPDRLCAICYENFEGGIGAMPVIETDCQHRFHKYVHKNRLIRIFFSQT